MIEPLIEQNESTYRAEIRAATRALWSGAMDFDQAFDLMMFNIRAGLTSAWHAGAAEVGILPAELTPEERTELEQVVYNEINRVGPFLSAVEQGSKAEGGKLSPLMLRADLWANRYLDVRNRAKEMAHNDPKLQWLLGATEEHCSTCNSLHGKIKRASYWQRVGLHPQQPPNPALECGGWRCLCMLEPSEEPLSRGPLPGIWKGSE